MAQSDVFKTIICNAIKVSALLSAPQEGVQQIKTLKSAATGNFYKILA